MTSQSVDKYLSTTEVPRNPTAENLYQFFGIPPGTVEQLDDNIKLKRRHWRRLTNSRNSEGRELAETILARIQEFAKWLQNGTTGTVDEPTPNVPLIDEINLMLENLSNYIFNLLNNGRFDQALTVASSAREKWPDSPIPHAEFANVISNRQQSRGIRDVPLLNQGLEASYRALQLDSKDLVSWRARVELMNLLDRFEDAISSSDEAASELGQMPTPIRVERANAQMNLGRADNALADCALAITGDPENYAARGLLAENIISRLVEPLLPISSRSIQLQYSEMVQVAAWCANGVPEAETLVRPHQIWAVQSGQRVFSGNPLTRSFFAVMTGFLSLPVHHRLSSDQAWNLFLKGPNSKHLNWDILTSVEYLREVHKNVNDKLPWAESNNGAWPTRLSQE